MAAEELEPNAPETGSPPPDDAPASVLIEKTAQTQKELDAERRELDSIKTPESRRADSLRRRLTDALILNGLGQGELRMRRIVSGRLRRIGKALSEYPVLLQQAADLISKGTDIADYAYDKWHVLKKRIFKAGTATLREISADLTRYARRLEPKRSRPRKPKRINIEEIRRLVSRQYKVSRAELLSLGRTARVVRPRQIAMYLAKDLTVHSLVEIGRRFGGRDHTTVLHAVRKIERMIDNDNVFAQEIDLLKGLLQK